jgi:uncharacterized membrane protein (GlpM family)
VNDVITVVAKGLCGGALVVAFAVLSEMLKPKRFAGLLGAAPAVAIAGLAITVLSKGAHDARDASTGMLAGCAGMVVCAAVAVEALKRMRPLAAALCAVGSWVVVAGLVGAVVL